MIRQLACSQLIDHIHLEILSENLIEGYIFSRHQIIALCIIHITDLKHRYCGVHFLFFYSFIFSFL